MAQQVTPVLVVEDDDDTRDMVVLFLEHCGYPVSAAANGVEALVRVGQKHPCLILLDINMPTMDGAAFARALRRLPDTLLAQTPILLLTAHPNAIDIMREIGAVALVEKPIALDQLAIALQRHCPLEPWSANGH